MLDGYGLHMIIWDSADERLGDFLVASPADATGRGLELHVRQGGAAADLTGAEVYFIWRHKMTGTRGCEPMTEIDASLGQFVVYYPAAMQEAEGAVDAQFMVTHDGKSISTRAFTIRVEPVIIGGTESEDGFTLFVETIMRYEGAIEITTAAADAANEAAEAANDAADSATVIWQHLFAQIYERIRPASLNPTGVMQPSVECNLQLSCRFAQSKSSALSRSTEAKARPRTSSRLSTLFADSTTALSQGLPGRDADLSIPKAESSASISPLRNSDPLSLWKTSMAVSGNATFEKAALTSRASLRRPHEQPTISRL